jgi:hypothetical protein
VLANPVRAGLCEQAADWPWNGSRTGGMAWRIVRPRAGAQTAATSAPSGESDLG